MLQIFGENVYVIIFITTAKEIQQNGLRRRVLETKQTDQTEKETCCTSMSRTSSVEEGTSEGAQALEKQGMEFGHKLRETAEKSSGEI